jgi:hypothetical protein
MLHDHITKPFFIANLLTNLPLTAAVIVASTYAVQVGPFIARFGGYHGTQVLFFRFQTITDLRPLYTLPHASQQTGYWIFLVCLPATGNKRDRD